MGKLKDLLNRKFRGKNKTENVQTIVKPEMPGEGELSEDELDEVIGGVPYHGEKGLWCPNVDVDYSKTGELTEEELDEVKAGVPIIDEER